MNRKVTVVGGAGNVGMTAARAIAKAAAYNAMRPVNDQKLIPNAGVRGPSTWRRPVRT